MDTALADARFDRRQVSASELIVELAGQYAIKDVSAEEPEIEAIVCEISECGAAVGSDAPREQDGVPHEQV